MKLVFECRLCKDEQMASLHYNQDNVASITIEESVANERSVSIREDGFYHHICEKGHSQIEFINNPKFEVLYESGINAMIDGYHAESVLTITAALERAYESFIEMISFNNDVEPELYETTYKLIANQSERQLGAFYLLYVNELKQPPPEFKMAKFRNGVIHKGKIPSLEETDKYAKHVFELIQKTFYDGSMQLGFDRMQAYNEMRFGKVRGRINNILAKQPGVFGSIGLPTMINHAWVINQYMNINYEASLVQAKLWKARREDPVKYLKDREGPLQVARF